MLAHIATAFALVALAAVPATVRATSVETVGEAAILGDDVASARLEALARARWHAVEQVAGVEINAASFVNDFTLLDETIIKRARGVILSDEVLSEARNGDSYAVRARVDVGPAPAREALMQMARNRAIAVYLPARMLDGSVRDSHALAEAVIDALATEGYEVIDLADRKFGVAADELSAALRRNDYSSMRSVLYRYLANVVLIGTIELVPGARRGDSTALGRLPYDIVTARLDYRLVSGEGEALRRVLASGHKSEKGAGSNRTQAAERALEELGAADPDSVANLLIDEVRTNVKANTGRVRVLVDGIDSFGADQSVRQALQAIAWVGAIEGVRMGEYVVEYPEPSLYLAASLGQRSGFHIEDFTPSSVSARYYAP